MDKHWILFLFLVTGAKSGPLFVQVNKESSTSCSTKCSATHKFQYAPGTSYEFEYETETRTSMQGASDEQATLKITATAIIDVLTKCDLVLRLENVMVYGSDPNASGRLRLEDQSGEFQQALEQHHLRFSFQDGTIDRLCTFHTEPSWVRNIKRGVLSTFQNSMDSLERDQTTKETDVTGTCHTDYRVAHKGWHSTTLKKTKDLISCTGRHGYETALQSIPYHIPTSFQSLPLMKSSHECDQEISSSGRLQHVVCHEFHVFRPFSKENSGATTEVTQKLDFVSERQSRNKYKEPVELDGTMEFEHTLGEKEPERNRREAERKLRELCDTTGTDIRPETPQIFSELVYILKTMDTSSLRFIYGQLQSRTFCPSNADRTKKFFVDAIPMVGTGASVGLMTDLLSNEDITGIEAEMWLTSLAFIHHPTREMLSELLALLQMDSIKGKVLLSVSTMIHRFCETDADCETYTEVSDIITVLERTIGYGCRVDESSDKGVLLSLRAIGNAGHADRLVPILNSCFGRHENPMEIRIAAVEAFRRLSCGADRNNLMSTFRNSEEDSELRIAAYWSVMQCSTPDILSQVKVMLEREEVNQVGSFVWSHLTNLMETSDPYKQDIREILEDEILMKVFDMDKRKFSRNYEGSFFWKKLGAGAKLESNIVWSAQSFVPRSLMANFTIDIFGNSLNLLEVGGRMEGLEYLLESYFGPAGYFSASSKDTETPEAASHSKISRQKMKQIDQKYGATRDKLKASMYLRMFGNELRYMNIAGPGSITSGDDFNILDFFMKLSKKHDYSMSKSLMFLDSSIIIPTVAGLPLNLTVNGTATVELKASGRMDLRKPASNLIIDGLLQPSGAVQISSMMSIDAYVTKSGLKMTSSLHSSTALQGRIEMSKKQIVSVEFSMPRDKMEILDVRTNFFTIHRDVERRQDLITSNRKQKSACTGAKIVKLTGLELCGDVAFSNASMLTDAPYFPLTGPVVMSLVLHKRDTHTGYKFEAKKIKTEEESLFRVFFDTPGSQVDRAVAIDAVVQHQQNAVEINLVSPWKKAVFKGSLVNTEDLKRLKGNFIIDDTREYALLTEIQRDHAGELTRFIPTVEITIPKRDSIRLTGMVEYQPKKKIAADMALQGAFQDPVTVRAAISNTDEEMGISASFSRQLDKEYSLDVKVGMRKEKKKLFLEPVLHVRTPSKDFPILSGTIEYRRLKMIIMNLNFAGIIQPSILKCTVSRYMKTTRSKVTAKIIFRHPKAHTKLNFGFDRKGPKIGASMKLDFNFARYLSRAKDTVTILVNSNKKRSPAFTEIQVTTSVDSARNPDYNNKMTLVLNHHKKHTDTTVNLHYGSELEDPENQHKIHFSTSTQHKITWPDISLGYNISFQYPIQDVNIQINGNHDQSRNDITSNTHVQYGTGKSVESSIRLRSKSKSRLDYSAEASLTLPNRHLFMAGDVSEGNRKDYTAHLIFEPNIRERSTIEAHLRNIADNSYQLDSTVNIHDEESLQLRSLINYNPNNLIAQGEVARGKDKYSFKTTSVIKEGRSGQFDLDIKYPSRHIILDIVGNKRLNKVYGKADLKWDADNNRNSRFLIDSTGDVQSISSFAGSLILQYPSRKVIANVKHRMGDRHITHADIAWNRRDKIALDLTMRDITENVTRRLEADLEFSSPFQGYRGLNASLSHVMAINQYMSKASILWGQKNKILSSFMLRKPVLPQNFHVNGLFETPYDGLRHLFLAIDHDFNDELLTSVTTEFGEKRFHASVNGNAAQTLDARDAHFDMSLDSNMPSLERFKLKLVHKDNSSTFVTKISNHINGDDYLYELIINHKAQDRVLDNSGSLVLSTPKDTMRTSWTHHSKQTEFDSSISTTWKNGQQFHANFNGNYVTTPSRKVVVAANFNFPSEKVKQLSFSFNHEDHRGYIQTKYFVETNRQKTSAIIMNYRQRNGVVDFDFTFSNLGKSDVIFKIYSEYASQPFTGYMELQWSPFHKAFLDGSLSYTKQHTLDGTLRFVSPFRGLENVILTITHKREGFDWIVETKVLLENQQNVNLNIRYCFDEEKMVRFLLTTSYPQVSRIGGGFVFDGDLHRFSYTSDFEMHPMVGRYDATADWRYDSTMAGSIHINTPITWLPYMQASISSEKQGHSRVSMVQVEYLPTKIIGLETTYSFTSANHLEGAMTFVSPFGDDVHALFSHQGDIKQFQTHVEITYNRDRQIIVDAKFALRPKISVIFSLTSPIRGYENVALRFSHEGNMKSFDTHFEYETNGNKIEVETAISVFEPYIGKFVVKTPFPVINVAQLSFRHSGSLLNFENQAQLTYNDYNFEYDVTFSHHATSTSGSMTVKTPFQGFRETQIQGNRSGTFRNFYIDSQLQYDQGHRFAATLHNTLEDGHFNTQVTLITPYTEDFEFHLTYTQTATSLTVLLKVEIGQDNMLHHTMNYNFNRQLNELEITSESIIVLFGERLSRQFSLQHFGPPTSFKTQITASQNSQQFSADFSFNLRDWDNDQNAPVWAFWQHLEGQFEIQTPFTSLETAKAYIRYGANPSGFETNVELEYCSKIISAVVNVVLKPDLSVTVNINTPFVAYENISGSIRYTVDESFYNVKVITSYARGKTITVTSVLNMESPTMTGNMRITTPFHNFRTMEVEVTHKGNDLKNIHSTVFVTSSQFSPVRGELSLRYSSPSNLDTTMKIASSIDGFQNLILTIQNTKQSEKHLSRAEINLNEFDKIVADCSWEFENGRSQTSLTSQLTISSPYAGFREGSIKLGHSHSRGRCRNNIIIKHNTETYLDVDASYTRTEKHTAAFRFRQPRPMDFEFTGSKENNDYQGDLSLNWNKMNSNSMIRFEGSLSDNSNSYSTTKSVSFKSIHSSRTIGVQGSFKGTRRDFTSQGAVLWSRDSGKTVSYDLKWADKSRQHNPSYDSMLKLNVPSRNIEISGSYDGNQMTRTLNGTVLWDAENDRDKQVGMTVSYSPGQSKEAVLELRLPKISKDIRLRSQMTLNNGNVLFEGLSELIYATELDKKLSVSCKIERILSAREANYHMTSRLLHPHTNTDGQITLHVATSPDKIDMEVNVLYLMLEGRKQTLELKGNLDKNNKQVVIKMISPRQLTVTGDVKGGSTYTMNLQLDSKSSTMGTHLIIDPVRRSLDIQMNYDPENPENSFNLEAEVLNKTTIQVTAFRLLDSSYIRDGYLYVSLNKSHVLHTRLLWRPNILHELLDTIRNLGTEGYGRKMNSAVGEITDSIGEELHQRYRSITQGIEAELQPVGELLTTVLSSLQTDIDSARRELRHMYRRNDLFLQDISEAYDKAFGTFIEKLTRTVSALKRVYAESKQQMDEVMKRITFYPLKEKYDEILEEIAQKIKSYRLQVVSYLDEKSANLIEDLKAWAQTQQEHLQRLPASVFNSMSEMLNTITEHPRVKLVRAQYANIVQQATRFRLDQISIEQYKKALQAKIESILRNSNLLDKFNVLLLELNRFIQSQIDGIMESLEIQLIDELTNEIYQQGRWAYDFWKIEDSIKEMLDKVFENVLQTLMLEKSRYIECIRNLRKPHFIAFDLERGEIDMEVYLPVPMEDFYRFPQINTTKLLRKIKLLKDKFILARNFSIWDVYYRYSPPMEISHWIPPFDAVGTVSGNHHFVTFDGSHFDFVGLCRYVLAKDMLDGNFSVILNYGGTRSQAEMESLLVISNGKNVEIFSNYLVKVDERPTELPYTFQNLFIHRHGNLIEFNNGMGLGITADLSHNLVTVGVSGWYFGRMAGLLGTYDNEPSNDLMMTNKVLTSDVGDFVNSWEVTSSCRSHRNLAQTMHVDEGSRGYDICATFFKESNSPFRPCFGQVEPAHFLPACVEELQRNGLLEENMCNTSAHYIQHCHQLGVNIQFPKMCVRCSGPESEEFMEGETIHLSNKADDLAVPRSVDVVVVVEEKSCISDLAIQLRDLVFYTDKQLRRTGLNGNRYGLVGFSSVSAHPHTIEGGLFNDAKKFAMGIESLKYTEDGEIHNLEDGLVMAANYPFRSGVGKTILLVTCSTCPDPKLKAVEYELAQKGITLHVLREQQFSSNANSNLKILGADSDEAYTIRDRQDRVLRGSEKLHSSLNIHSDACLSLAMRTNGSLFDASNMLASNIRQKKGFLEIFGNRVSQTATPDVCQTCQCVADNTGYGVSVCQPCSNSYSLWNYIPHTIQSTKLMLPKIGEFTQQLKAYFD